MDHNTKYNINPRIAELILKQKQKLGMTIDEGITNVDAENIFKRWLKSDKVDVTKYTLADKKKLLFNMIELNPNQNKDEKLLKYANNIKSVFDDSEIMDFLKRYTLKFYKPGLVISQVRSYNDGFLYFLSQFDNLIKMYNGIIINTSFIGDVIKLIPDVEKDNIGNILDPDIDAKLLAIIQTLKNELPNIVYAKRNDVYIIATGDTETFELMKSLYDKIEFHIIPEFFFDWK